MELGCAPASEEQGTGKFVSVSQVFAEQNH